MAKVKITQCRSSIKYCKRQRDTLKALGIRRMHHSVVHEATPQILGMAKTVSHLVKTENVK
ncbi:MAG: 50S ribosomal protein L30 [Bacteroidota bacterium]